MSTLDRTIRELTEDGFSVVAVRGDAVEMFPAQSTQADEPEDDYEVPPYPLQAWAKRRIEKLLNEPGDNAVWNVRNLVSAPGHEPVSPLGQRVRRGFQLWYKGKGGQTIYVGDRLLRAIRENFPGRIEE